MCLNQELNQQIKACVATSCNVREQLSECLLLLSERALLMHGIAVQRYSMESCGVKSRDKRRLVVVSGVIFGVIAVTATCLRVFSKCIGTGGTFGMDDYCLIAATVCAIGSLEDYRLTECSASKFHSSHPLSFVRIPINSQSKLWILIRVQLRTTDWEWIFGLFPSLTYKPSFM